MSQPSRLEIHGMRGDTVSETDQPKALWATNESASLKAYTARPWNGLPDAVDDRCLQTRAFG